jgi:hypothetical protein
MAKLARTEKGEETSPENSSGSFWGDWLDERAAEIISEKEEHNIWTRAIHAALLAAEPSK